MKPKISVVIPTRNRPDLVARAVKSALNQTLKELEVLVIIDGVDEATRESLAKICDSRLRVIELPEQRGAPVARNTGAAEAQAEWIALLDDDDEWMARKLEIQLDQALNSLYPLPVVSSYVIARTPKRDLIWPRRLPNSDEEIGEYLFTRKSLFMGEALLLTSTLLVRKEVFEKVPFKIGLRKNQDSDWLLKVGKLPGVGVEFVPDALTVWYREEGRKSTSATYDWLHTFAWAQEIRPLLSPESYASLLLVGVGSDAYLQGDYKAFSVLLREASQAGKITLAPIAFYILNWIVPQSVRRNVRDVLAKK